MDKPLYPEGVEVHQTDLIEEPTQREYHILRRFSDTATMGIVSGLEITVGTPDTTVDVSSGWGYVPSGEIVELASPVASLSLADDTAGAANYVCLIYRETAVDARAHETSGATHETKQVRASELKVLDKTMYDALPQSDTDPIDYTTDVKDRILVVGRVFGAGPGTSIPSGNVQSQIVGSWADIVTSDQPTNITGIRIVSYSTGTRPSSDDPTDGDRFGRLWYDGVAKKLAYQAPFDTGYGTQVSVPASPGDVTLTSADGTTTVNVHVEPSLLPRVLGEGSVGSWLSVTDDLTVEVLHRPVPGIAHASDEVHRRTMGTRLPTPDNPHGLTLDDVSAGLFHGRAISGDSTDYWHRLIPRGVYQQSRAAPTDHRTLIWEWLSGGLSAGAVRFYMSGTYGLEITLNARWDGATYWLRDVPGQATVLRFETEKLDMQSYDATGGTSQWADTDWSSTWRYDTGIVSGTARLLQGGVLDLGSAMIASAASAREARISVDTRAHDAEPTLLFKSDITGLPSASYVIVRCYRIADAARSAPVLLLFNAYCETSSGSVVFKPDTFGQPSMAVEASAIGLKLRWYPGTQASWGWSDWSLGASLSYDGNLTISGNLTLPALTLNGTIPAPPAANTLYAPLIPKAGGLMYINGTSLVPIFGNVAYGVDTVNSTITSFDGTNDVVKIVLATPMTSSAFLVQCWIDRRSTGGFGQLSNNTVVRPITKVANNAFYLQPYSISSNSTYNLMSGNGSAGNIGFVVFGSQ